MNCPIEECPVTEEHKHLPDDKDIRISALEAENAKLQQTLILFAKWLKLGVATLKAAGVEL